MTTFMEKHMDEVCLATCQLEPLGEHVEDASDIHQGPSMLLIQCLVYAKKEDAMASNIVDVKGCYSKT
jgi:hypothetical protein